MKKAIWLPLVLTISLTSLVSCDDGFSSPGKEMKLEEAMNYVHEHFDTRTNLAKSTITSINVKNLSIDGIMYPSEEYGPTPIQNPTVINTKTKDKKLAEISLNNKNGVVGTFLLMNAYRQTEQASSDPIFFTNYLFNCWIDEFDLDYIDMFRQMLEPGILETRFTLDNNIFYVTYRFNDLMKATNAIKEVEDLFPDFGFIFPFLGEGKAKFMFGFDQYGYPTLIKGQVESDNITMYAGRVGKGVDTTFFEGKIHGTVTLNNQVTLYQDNEIPHISFNEINAQGVKIETSYKHRAAKTSEEWNGVGKDYYDKIYEPLAPYYDRLLPGYGSSIVIEDKAKNIFVTVDGTRTNITNIDSSSYISSYYFESENKTCIYIYPAFNDIVKTDFSLDIEIMK